MSWGGYLQIARVDHWFKNVLLLPGTALAVFLTGTSGWQLVPAVLGALLGTSLVASANYAANEWLDADYDRFHPLKRRRPSVAGGLSGPLVALEYVLLLTAGLAVSATISGRVAVATASLGVMGVVYNVKPLRTKDRAYLDVLSESVNNPIRLLIGWFAVVDSPLPPASLVFGYWMVGAFLMAVKRYAELRYLDSPEMAGNYRLSFRYYTPERLLACAVFYSCCASFFLGVFLVKYRVELLPVLPFLALGFAWYMQIGMRVDSPAQRPEKLHRERGFAAYLGFVTLLLLLAFLVELPALEWLLQLPDY
jgi:4-hydroxybenzoate polyprenyltransferase